ncbi:MAG: hypothetical protein AB8B99_08075 [Phormidesmis sp.]
MSWWRSQWLLRFSVEVFWGNKTHSCVPPGLAPGGIYFANAHNKNRGTAKSALGDKQGAIADYKKVMTLYQQQGNTKRYNSVERRLKSIRQI